MREMYVRATVRHFTPTGMAESKTMTSAEKDMEQLEASVTDDGMLHGATALQNSLTQKFCSYVDAQKK
jgi:hypothetical protein